MGYTEHNYTDKDGIERTERVYTNEYLMSC